MVVVLGAAFAVQDFARVGTHGVDFLGIDHRLQRSVHGGEPHPLAVGGEGVVNLLGADEGVRSIQPFADGASLAGLAVSFAGERKTSVFRRFRIIGHGWSHPNAKGKALSQRTAVGPECGSVEEGRLFDNENHFQ